MTIMLRRHGENMEDGSPIEKLINWLKILSINSRSTQRAYMKVNAAYSQWSRYIFLKNPTLPYFARVYQVVEKLANMDIAFSRN
jgi:hypothetical protein